MTVSPEYRITICMLALTAIAVLLLSTPGLIFVEGITLVDTEIQHSSGHEVFVTTKLDFSNSEEMRSFPERMGNWSAKSYNKSSVEKSLGADVLLSRTYWHEDYFKPIFFLIMQSDNVSSFHPPTVCYPALGWEIETEKTGGVEFNVTDVAWTEGSGWLSEHEGRIFHGSISAKKLVVYKEHGGEITDRRVVFYYFVKDEKHFIPSSITLIRISTPSGSNSTDEDALELCKKLAADTFPLMFELRPPERMLGEMLVAEHGAFGCLTLALLFLVPIGILLLSFPGIRRRFWR